MVLNRQKKVRLFTRPLAGFLQKIQRELKLENVEVSIAFVSDVEIAPETARRYAKKNGRTLQSELRILMLHGVLHLVGYDHESDNGQMNRIEQKLRRRLGIA